MKKELFWIFAITVISVSITVFLGKLMIEIYEGNLCP